MSARPRARWIQLAATLIVLVARAADPREMILFAPGEGARPEMQGWLFGQVFQTARVEAGATSVRLDTLAAFPEIAGWSRQVPTLLPENVHALTLHLKVEAEEHLSLNRAGFSVLVLNNARRGIELAFWTNGVFAQGDQPLFFQAEWAGFNTTARLIPYELRLEGLRYELRADGEVILSGPLRDYTPFAGFLDPYETPNLVFLGDNTGGGRGRVELGEIRLLHASGYCPPGGGLRVEQQAGRTFLAWPDDPDRDLEWAPRLEGVAGWSPANLPVSIQDCERRSEVPVDAASGFFRLR